MKGMATMNWKNDINQLVKDLPNLHANFFHHIKKEDFYQRGEELKRDEKKMNTYAMVVGLAKMIALAGDAHTALEVPKNNRMPIECYWFEEGIYITKADLPFNEIISAKILAVEGFSIAKVIEKLTEMISHENIQFVKAQLPQLLVCTDVLYGLGICPKVEEVNIEIQGMDGAETQIILPSVKYAEWDRLIKQEDFLNREGLFNKDDFFNKGKHLPLYRRNGNLYYWKEELENGESLYVAYKKCKDMETLSVEEFCEDLKRTLEKGKKLKNMILDFRQNSGGNSELFRPFIEWLSDFQMVRQEITGRPFKVFVIVGRDTFSSALLNVYLLHFKTKATFIGEPTGGKPNCYGEVNYFTLNESGLSVRYSTRYYYLIEEYDLDSFYPEIIFDVSFKDYRENKDPCMEWIEQEVAEKNE